MDPLELLRNLTMMAAADGTISDEEQRLLQRRRDEWGVSERQFRQVLQDAVAGKFTLTIPTQAHRRHDLLVDLVEMMMADGRIDQAERRLLGSAARQMGVATHELEQLIEDFSEDDDALTLGEDVGGPE